MEVEGQNRRRSPARLGKKGTLTNFGYRTCILRADGADGAADGICALLACMGCFWGAYASLLLCCANSGFMEYAV